jgi:hypothetical protein
MTARPIALKLVKKGHLSSTTSTHRIDPLSSNSEEEAMSVGTDMDENNHDDHNNGGDYEEDVMSNTEVDIEMDGPAEHDEESQAREETVAVDGKPRQRNREDRYQSPHPDYLAEDFDEGLPYAPLIQRALMSTPSRSMTLAQIYDYFGLKYKRFRNTRDRGWKCSVRHNLSLNSVSLFQIFYFPRC